MSREVKLVNINRPDTGVIELLESLLEAAKKGEIHAMAYVTAEPAGNVVTGWAMSRDRGMYHYLNSGAARLATRLALD